MISMFQLDGLWEKSKTSRFSAAQGGCGVSFSGDIQNPSGHDFMQPAVGDPALAGRLDWMIPRGPFQPLPFCDSVKTFKRN